jgi:protein-S-isoprenylcysteine O-methyltransferase Ste14
LISSQSVAPPNTIPWPPIIVGAAVVLAVALGWLLPLRGLVPAPLAICGGAVIVAGVALDVAAMSVMQRNRANILPHRAATRLVASWPFSMSRNPIYLGNTIMLGGAALAFRNPWFLLTAGMSAWIVTNLAIRREERHLAALFGTAWDDYAARVPRWIRLAR